MFRVVGSSWQRFDSAHRSVAGWHVNDDSDHDLNVLIPAFNEENRLPGTLRALSRFMTRWAIDYRVIVVDDGSSDNTASISEGFGPRFSTLRLDRQCGKGAAVRRGMLSATGRVVAFTDADLPYDLAALRTAYDWVRAGQCQVVFGARDLAESRHQAARRPSRTAASAVFRGVTRLLAPTGISDTQCGLKVFSRAAAHEIFSRTTLDGFAFDVEVALLCSCLQIPLQRVPVTLVNEYASTLSLTRHGWRMLCDVARVGLRYRLARGRTPPVRELPERRQYDQLRRARKAA